MSLDFSEYFKKYEALLAEVDAVFAKIQQTTGDLVRCEKGCSDCCYALFDLPLIEALYLNHHFNATYSGMERSRILERADKADRLIYKLKRKAFKAGREGVHTSEILEMIGKERVRCPLLGEDDLCVLYKHRPVTCRLYGVPTQIGDNAHTCGRSGFEPGQSYPTVKLEALQNRLTALSRELVESLDTTHTRMWDVLVPPSMALMTEYDEQYLGIKDSAEPVAEPAPQTAEACSSCDREASSCGQDPASCGDAFSITIGQADDGGNGK